MTCGLPEVLQTKYFSLPSAPQENSAAYFHAYLQRWERNPHLSDTAPAGRAGPGSRGRFRRQRQSEEPLPSPARSPPGKLSPPAAGGQAAAAGASMAPEQRCGGARGTPRTCGPVGAPPPPARAAAAPSRVRRGRCASPFADKPPFPQRTAAAGRFPRRLGTEPTCGGGAGGGRRGRGRRGGGAGTATAGRLPEGAVGGEVSSSVVGDGAAQPLHGQHQGHRGRRHLEVKQRGECPAAAPSPDPPCPPRPAPCQSYPCTHGYKTHAHIACAGRHGVFFFSLGQEKARSSLPQRARVPGTGSLYALPQRRPLALLPPPPPPPWPRPQRCSHTSADPLRRFPFSGGGDGTARPAPAGLACACCGACVCVCSGVCVCVCARERAQQSAIAFLSSSLPKEADSRDLGSCFH